MAKEIGPLPKARDIRFGDNLPKTRSGKIMRRLLHSITKGEAITQTPARWKTRNPGSTGPDQLTPFTTDLKAPAKRQLFLGLSDLRLFGPFISSIAAPLQDGGATLARIAASSAVGAVKRPLHALSLVSAFARLMASNRLPVWATHALPVWFCEGVFMKMLSTLFTDHRSDCRFWPCSIGMPVCGDSGVCGLVVSFDAPWGLLMLGLTALLAVLLVAYVFVFAGRYCWKPAIRHY